MSNLINNGSIEPKVFRNEFYSVRVIVDPEPIFCLIDICKGLEISDKTYVSRVIREKFGAGSYNIRSIKTKGGLQNSIFLNLEQLNFVLERTNKKNVASFKMWLSEEIIPNLFIDQNVVKKEDDKMIAFIFDDYKLEYAILNGEPLFNLNSVARFLDIKNPRSSINVNDPDYAIKVHESAIGFIYSGGLNSMGELFLTEAGFYRLVLRSNKPKAEKFIKWVTKEVIPTIRKTGHYGFKPMTLKDSLKLNLELLEKNEVLTAENKELKVELKYQTEKADNYDYTEKERRSKQELVTKFNKTVRTLAEQKFECNYAGAYTYVYNEFDKLHCINQPINLEFLKKNNDYLAECLKIATNELN